MTEKEQQQQQGVPLAGGNGYARSDQEASSAHAKELRRKKRIRCLLYVLIFAVFQIGVITLFAMTIMKFRNPSFRVRSATFGTSGFTTTAFNTSMNVQFGVKNTNFGHFRYRDTAVDFYYGDTKVGEAMIQSGRARWRSTRRFSASVDLSSNNITSRGNNTQLSTDVSLGILPLRAESRLRGRVTILLIMKRNRAANMYCTMDLAIGTGELRNLTCN